jgi:predicted negative regulator of RcsB-dependent stress response
MSIRFFSPLLLVIGLLSCHSHVNQRLDLAESILEVQPDSALNILNEIKENELLSRRLQARHALLKSMALDKNYIDIADDSIINCALTYYSEKGTRSEKMKAWYYQGIVQKNAGNLTASAVSLEMSEKEALAIPDFHMLGLIYRNMAEVFSATNNGIAAIQFIKKSIDAFESNADSIYAQYAKYSLAVAYLNNNETSQSYTQLTRLLHSQTISPSLRAQCQLCLARVFVEEGDSLEKAVSIYRQTPEKLYHVLDYGLCSIALHDLGLADSAQFWVNKGYRTFDNREMTASLQYLHSKIAYKDEDYKLAYLLEDKAIQVQDSLTRVLLQQSLSNAQRDYYKDQLLIQEGIVKRQKAGMISGIGISLLVLTILILINRQKKQMEDIAVKEQMARLSLTRDNTLQANARLIGVLVTEKIAHLHHLSDDYFQEEDQDKKKKAFIQFKQTLRKIRNDESFFNNLESDLNLYCNGIMEKLSLQVPKIIGPNRKLIALLFAGLPGEWVQVLGYKNSSGSIKTSRSRFRDIIKAANAEDEKLFLDMLEVKKGGRKPKPTV